MDGIYCVVIRAKESLMANTIEIWKGKGHIQPWRYKVKAGNGEQVAASEGYFSKWNARRAAQKLYPDAEVVYPKS